MKDKELYNILADIQSSPAEAKNYSIASRIIADTIEAKLVKPYSDSQSKKYAQYIPIWA